MALRNALASNWWSISVRMLSPRAWREAKTSRPQRMEGVAARSADHAAADRRARNGPAAPPDVPGAGGLSPSIANGSAVERLGALVPDSRLVMHETLPRRGARPASPKRRWPEAERQEPLNGILNGGHTGSDHRPTGEFRSKKPCSLPNVGGPCRHSQQQFPACHEARRSPARSDGVGRQHDRPYWLRVSPLLTLWFEPLLLELGCRLLPAGRRDYPPCRRRQAVRRAVHLHQLFDLESN